MLVRPMWLCGFLVLVTSSGSADNVVFENENAALFSMTVFKTCQEIENGKEKSVVDRLLRAGIKPEIDYFDIVCPSGGLLLSYSLQQHNYKSAQFLLHYLRWRERETQNADIRQIILNAPDENGETLVDRVRRRINTSTDIVRTLELKSFLHLFRKHGGNCLKSCNE